MRFTTSISAKITSRNIAATRITVFLSASLHSHVTPPVVLCYNFKWSKLERRIAIPISYDKLWKLLIDKKMNRTDLKDASGISFNVLAKMGKNEFVSMESLSKICVALDCNIGDIVDIIPEKA